MPLSKKDDPSKDKAAEEAIADAGAGAPPAQEALAEDLPEGDEVEKAIKEGMTADDAQTEAEAKAKVVELSPDAAETPSGSALAKTAHIEDDVERGEAYAREKQAARWGTAPVEEEDK